jgi:pyruvate,water dikinase
MGRIRQFLARFKGEQPPPPDEADLEALRVDFKSRYYSFKLLLSANNKALDIMADIEAALHGDRPFGMSFVRGAATSTAVNVWRIVQNLDRLAPEKYTDLFAAFKRIQQQINRVMQHRRANSDHRLLIQLADIDKDTADLVGSKMANLGELKRNAALNLPQGFALTAFAYQRFIEHNELQPEINRRIQKADKENTEERYRMSIEIQQMIVQAEVPTDIVAAVDEAWGQLKNSVPEPITVAVRSSALGEDTTGSSFAGQYRSLLNVDREYFFDAYREVVASKYSMPAMTYRLTRGLRDEDIAMCVGCLVMIDAVSGGVIYTRNPVDIRDDSIFINSAWGLPKSVVDGSDACDLFVVSRREPMRIEEREIQHKEKKFVCFPEEGVCRMVLAETQQEAASLTEAQAIALAQTAVALEAFYGSPQDIEWAIDRQEAIFVLQCRPLRQTPEGDSNRRPAAARTDDDTLLMKGGITASPGVGYGQTFVVEKGSDQLRFPEGAVMVIRQALPRWASILNRAAAVVAEQGSFAGHLANVAREFGVPALFGMRGALADLPADTPVTVDASGQAIYRGRREDLLSETAARKNLMRGSPVYETLQRVSEHIVPLHLLDPDAPEFQPANCRTFHDITRFSHEKSVHEMFDFGRDHNFSERSSKQLHYHVPMQWWVLNLDDGFQHEIRGKYVKLEDIQSIPMLAFWKGFIAIPWEGPPAIDGKGFMAVMFQSTANRALTTGTRSRYAEKNYFMISRHFLNLNSRLGYHFSILEALVGERSTENYISFRFSGGAADYQRRIKRVEFIADILEKQGFRVETQEDTLSARTENQPMGTMQHLLEILGYLTLHTRQLDMIMGNPARINHYRQKILQDIEQLDASKPV